MKDERVIVVDAGGHVVRNMMFAMFEQKLRIEQLENVIAEKLGIEPPSTEALIDAAGNEKGLKQWLDLIYSTPQDSEPETP
jgi:hypothetical protein